MDENNANIQFSGEFKVLFDKLEEYRGSHNELFIVHSQTESVLPEAIDEMKKIIDLCTEETPSVSFTMS